VELLLNIKELNFMRIDGWKGAAFAVSMLVLVPLAVILLSFLTPAGEIWDHLIKNVLSDLLINTFWLVAGVSVLTVILGVSLAWLTAVCDFPGRKIFSWALLLPLAVPTYVLAFVYLGLLDFAGPVQALFRDWFGAGNLWFPSIRSTGGVIAVMSLALYPYIYLIVRNAFMTQGVRTLEVAQSLGYNRREGFIKIALPMARPWIAGGLMLVLMETLADFGAVSIFNFDTFTTAIYKAWFGFFSLSAAAQLSSILVAIVFIIIVIEQRMRARMRYYQPGRHSMKAHRFKLRGPQKWMAFSYSLVVLLTAFVIPSVQLSLWSLNILSEELNPRYFGLLTHSLSLGLIASVVTCFLALLLSYARRRHPDKLTDFFVRTSTLGYALPGTILAVGIFIPVAFLDNAINGLAMKLFETGTGPLLQGTLLVMVTAYVVRFMAAGFNSIDNAMQRITKSIDEAARGMGLKGLNMLRRIHLPILRAGVLTAVTMVFIDVMKEMPITLMTRPFGWDTLAVKIYELTSEGEWERAALPAITLIMAGLIPIILLVKHSEKEL
jgi:iron(III) transport system permease protein